MKKFLIVLLVLIMSLTCLVSAFAETSDAAAVTTEETVTAVAEEEQESAFQTWLNSAVKKVIEVKWYVWVILALLFVFGIVMCAKSNLKWTSRRLSYAAMCIAISFVLSLLRMYRMPQGGSITLLSKLPLVMFTMACGPAYGLIAGCAQGLISLIQDPYVIHPIQLLVDYPFASGAVALCYLAKYLPVKQYNVKLACATVLGYLGSYIMAVLSGAIFFGEYAWEGYSAWGYSLAYNISYAGPECIIAVIVVLAIPGLGKLVDMIGKKN